ncbi:protein Wnt-11b-like [Centruroides sculpturatus]|uniref:protein Wnt-11b-like n=1 Tax=Centruroides sculpturatus TaxID=218467 RepID=UPI000C6ED9DE|nr:protein Wnt-11b-like [Centruroides sculpturatus]
MRLFAVPLLLSACACCSAVRWLSLADASFSWNDTRRCVQAKNRRRLHASQVKFCKRQLDSMPFASMAAYRVARECHQVFSSDRWNCSSVSLAPNLTPDLTSGTREQAFVYALASAGLVHSLARACSAGALSGCGCGPLPREPPSGDFRWGGCGDDLRYGLQLARQFVEAPLRGKAAARGPGAAVDRHNGRTGRRVVATSLKTQCKCHGVSGACNVKTCWKALAPLQYVAQRLKLKYKAAVEVSVRHMGSKKRLKPVSARIATFGKDDLIYLTKSPDYCLPDAKTGSAGTRERTCNASSTGTDGCDSMCCGRGYRTMVEKRVVQCRCKYHWCCYVECQRCETEVKLHLCR